MNPVTSRFDLPERLSRYHVGSVIGVGGFAAVVSAFDEGLETEVAIKVLDRAHALDPEMRERFVREARLLRRVRNPSVVTVHDVGQTPDGLPFFVMDLASGGVLEDRLSRQPGPVGADDLRTVVATLSEGLGALHAANIVHRDVKPSNLLVMRAPDDGARPRAARPEPPPGGRLVGEGERLVIGDLGLAKDRDATAAGPTILGGTPGYQAPEQTEVGAPVDARTDVYGSTAVVWRLVTGQPPPPPDEVPVRLLGLPEAWRPVLARGLAVRPDDRFGSMSEWGAAVLAVVGAGATGSPSAVRPVAPGVTCPYKGLAPFEADDAPLFFGRTELVDQLVSRLLGRSTLAIGGPSGSGKSSLLRAGLLRALEAGALPGSQQWPQCLLSPGSHPLAALHAALNQLDGAADVPDLASLREEPGLARSAVGGAAVVAVDQFEELFTSCHDRLEREAFLAALQALTRDDPPVVRMVLAVRADFYGECAGHPWLAAVINENQTLVGPMSRSQLRQAIEGPARRVGLRLEEGLADRILDDAGDDPGTLPLLAHALVETWVRRRGPLLTLAGYETAGGVAGAIGRTADQIWERLDDDQRRAARQLLLGLVHTADGTADTRRLATWAELGDDPLTRQVVSTFADGRLLTVDERGVELAHEALIRTWDRLAVWLEESRDELRTRERIEAAAREWERAGRHPDLLYRGTPLAAALEWRASLTHSLPEPSESFLAAAEKARNDEEEAAAEAQRRRRQVRRRAATALGVLAALALASSVVAFAAFARSRTDARAAREATARATEQLARNLAASSMEQREEDPYLATVLATEALARVRPPLMEAREALVESRVALAGDRLVPYGDPIPVGDAITLVVDPPGERAVTGNRDGTLRLWDLGSKEERAKLTGPGGGIQEAAFAPDGSWIVAGSDDGAVWRWAVGGATAGTRLADLGSIVWSVAVSPDGRSVAAATQNGHLWLLDAASGQRQGRPVTTRTGDFIAVAFSPDGGTLLAGTGSGDVHVFSLPSREPRFPPVAAHTSDVWEILVTPDGQRFLTVSSDGTARMWDVETGAPLGGGPHDEPGEMPVGVAGVTLGAGGRFLTLGGPDGRVHTWSFEDRRTVDVTAPAHLGAVTDAARSTDGGTLVTLGRDQSIRVWSQHRRSGAWSTVAGLDAALFAIDARDGNLAVATGVGQVLVLAAGTGEELARLGGHGGRVFAVAFAGADLIVSGDDEGTLRVWDWRAGRVRRSVPAAHAGGVSALAVSEDRGLVASAGADRVVRRWDLDDLAAEGEPLGPLAAPLTDVALSPDGEVIVASSRSGEVARWSDDGTLLGEVLQAEDNTVWAVALSPDGRTLAVATDDEVVSLWSVAGAAPVRARDLSPLGGGALDVVFVDPTTVAAASRTGEVRLWDVASGQPLGPPLVATGSAAWHLATGADGTVWTATEAGEVVRVDALVPRAACALAAASFDGRQRARLLGQQEPLGCPSG